MHARRPLLVLLAAALLAPLPAAAQRLEARVDLGTPTPMPLTAEEVYVEIDHQHATTQLTQSYRNDFGSQIEGRYVLRTGEGARVRGFAYWNGEEKIVGEVLERQAAERVYRSVTTARRDPGLLEQLGEGLFTFRVFPIAPGENKRIEVTWAQWLRRRGAGVEHRVPLARPDARVRIAFTDTRPIRNLVSPTHRLEVRAGEGGRMHVEVLGARGAPAELVLAWDVADEPWNVTALVHRDAGHDAYLAITLPAPAALPESAIAPKDVTIVLDHSGSMQGEPLQRAKLAAIDIVRRLGRDDRVNVIQFDDGVDALWASPRDLTPDVRADAMEYLDGIRDGGGTNIAYALERALAAQDAGDPERPRVIVFITDGRSQPQAALQVAQRAAGDVRVFTVGIGEGVERPLLSRIAALRRGRFTYIESADAIESSVGLLYRQIEAPLLVGLALDVEGAQLQRSYPRSLPDLFQDDELRIVARVRGTGPMRVRIRGTFRGEQVVHEARFTVPEEVRRPWVGRVWAEQRVDDLLEEIALNGEQTELVDEVIELALAYRFVTPYTAFLAIPASELTAEGAAEMQSARQRSARILAANPDAAALMAGNGGGGGDAELQAMAGSATSPPSPGDDEMEPAYDLAMSPDRAGCASCAAAETREVPPAVGWLALAAGLLLARRRLRAPRAGTRGSSPLAGRPALPADPARRR